MSYIVKFFVVLSGILYAGTAAAADPYKSPWRGKNSAIVLDAYEYTLLDWEKLKNNERLAGFINKASDGLPPTPTCGRDTYCRLKWRRYVAAKELYHTRKTLAKTIGLKWGAYHLARPGNPIQQAYHFLRFTKPEEDELLALDIEHNDPSRWMSLEDAEKFARYVKKRVGRYPVLYTNHATAKFIAQNRDKYKLLSKLNLWYARYKADIRGVFPMGNWPSYTVWQFSSMANCNKRSCLRRIAGADNFIDVNVVSMTPEKLQKKWPFATLTARTDLPTAKSKAEKKVVAKRAEPQPQASGPVVSAFLPVPPEKKAARALKDLVTTDQAGSTQMAVKGRVAVPKWLPEMRPVEKTIIAQPEEIGVPSPLVALSMGPLRPQKAKSAAWRSALLAKQPPHTLDVLAQPRQAMLEAQKEPSIDGVLKLFPVEAVSSMRSSSETVSGDLF